MADNPSFDTAFSSIRLRRWGLYWIILGLSELLDSIFRTEIFMLFAVMIATLLVMPWTSSRISWKQWMLEFAANLCLILLPGLAFWWLGTVYQFDQRLAIAATTLLVGIALQIWSEIFWLPGHFVDDRFDRLLERIRRI